MGSFFQTFIINRSSLDGEFVEKLETSGNVFLPDVVETLRIDWKSEDREKFYPEKWEKCLDRSDQSLREQTGNLENFSTRYGGCKIKVVAINGRWGKGLKVCEVETMKGDSVGDLNCKIKEKCPGFDSMKVASVQNHQITRIFEVRTGHLTKEMFLNQTIIAFQIYGRSYQNYLAVNLFDLGTQSYFGVPFFIKKPMQSFGYDELQHKLKDELSMFLSKKSDRALGKKLDTWWSTRSIPKAVDIDEGRLEGVSFDVHKSVLIAMSEVFEAMLSSSATRESSKNELIIPDIQPRIVEELLKFIYYDNGYAIEANAFEMFVASDKYMLDRLKEFATIAIFKKELPKLRHVLRLASFGSCYNSEEIVKHAIEQILISFPAIIELPEWKSFIIAEPKLALKIFERLSKILF